MSDLIPIYVSLADKALFDAQKCLEDFTEQEAEARDRYTESRLRYELAYANYIRDHKKEGTITVLKETAQAENFDLYAKMVRDEANLKIVQAGKEMHLERINTAKIFLRIKFGDIRGNN